MVVLVWLLLFFFLFPLFFFVVSFFLLLLLQKQKIIIKVKVKCVKLFVFFCNEDPKHQEKKRTNLFVFPFIFSSGSHTIFFFDPIPFLPRPPKGTGKRKKNGIKKKTKGTGEHERRLLRSRFASFAWWGWASVTGRSVMEKRCLRVGKRQADSLEKN